MISQVYNMDCMEYMSTCKDKQFDLAIVDPPYGISQPAFRKGAMNKAAICKQYHNAVYKQDTPPMAYFTELFRISKNQIIWGANYYNDVLPIGRKWIFWDKKTEATQWGDGELAFTSFIGAIVKFEFAWNGMIQGNMKDKEVRIHPTQKPVALYKWTLKNFAKEGDKILDTYLGSGSSRIACYDEGFDFYATEIDKTYFDDQEERFQRYLKQPKPLFTQKDLDTTSQNTLL